LTQTIPKKSPYFPQLNDEVVYIPFGHKLYNEEVKRRRLYKITNTNKYIKTHFDTKVIAKVVQIKFVIESNIRLVILTLREMDPKTNIFINKQFNVRYHGMENMIDFIVLRKCYESFYSATKWKPGDQFRAIVEDKWRFGTIKGYNLNNELAKNTFFQLYCVEWADNQTQLLSIWDLDKINGIVPQNRTDSVDVTDQERELFYTSGPNEWPLCGKLEECERIAQGLDSLKINLFFNYFSYICLKVFFQSFHLFDYRFGYNNEVQRVGKVCISSRFDRNSILCAKNCLSVELNYY
jgi:bromodomain and WD repeat domain-containing protein 1/3